jgi:hypothetical protein
MKRVQGLYHAQVWVESLEEIELWTKSRDRLTKLSIEYAESQGFIHVQKQSVGLGGQKYINYKIILRTNSLRVIVNPNK